VRAQGPIALDDESEPEPDVTAVPGRARDYRRAHAGRPAAAPFGWSYASKEVLPAESSVAPLAVAGSRIVVADLLP